MADPALPRALSLAVHELRTPMTVLTGYLRMVLKEQAGPVTDKQRHMLEEAERSCGRITAVIAEMSEVAKLESGQSSLARSPVDLSELVAGLASAMHEDHGRDVRLEVRGTDHPIMVSGDRARIASTLSLLTRAALRERVRPGTIVASLTTVVTETKAAWAVFAVGEDSALEALVQQAEAGFMGFDEWRGGLGLGLPISRRVIEALDGAIWSAPGNRPRAGSALRLPLRK